MCGRYALKTSVPDIATMLDASAPAAAPSQPTPRYNIAPTQLAPVCRVDTTGERRMDLLRWGLIPFWSKDLKGASRMINARAETVAEKPAYRAAFRKRRCLVPADGYFEWRRDGSRKQPIYIKSPNGDPLFFAGLWERWDRDPDGALESFTIITAPAAGAVAGIHHRMPVALDDSARAAWLDPNRSPARILEQARPAPVETIPVSTYVNNPRNEGERCIQPIGPDLPS